MTSQDEARGTRVDEVVDLLARLASGDLSARGVVSPADDGLDAVVAGVNRLAEALEASREELDERVRTRTAELEQAHRDVVRLAELGSLLQSCESLEDAHRSIGTGLSEMFDGYRGALYEYLPAHDRLELQTSWGGQEAAPRAISPTDCWALRLRIAHAVRAREPALSCEHVVDRTGDSICVPMFSQGETIGILHIMGRDPAERPAHELGVETRQLVSAVAEQIALTLANLQLRKKLQTEALRDPLTGLHNRRFADDWIEREVSQSNRSGRPLGLIMVDVDHFKQVNDAHGHDAGDAVLKAIADTFRSSLRLGDVPCRIGGEEFMILMPDIDLDTLARRAETLREQVVGMGVRYHGQVLPPITVSAGVAVYPKHGRSVAEVVKAADAALYAAKRAGRNRTCKAV